MVRSAKIWNPINTNSISCFPFFPASLTNISNLSLGGNLFNCFPNYVPAMGTDTLIYPLCGVGNTNGCAVATAGIYELNTKEISVSVFPNPANNFISVSSSEKLGGIFIYNSIGEIVLKTKSENVKEQLIISGLPQGIYSLHVRGKNIKIIKE